MIPERIQYYPEMVREAVAKANALGSIKNSITSGGGNLAGYLGEIALAKHINAENISCNKGVEKFDHDLIQQGKKIEVKTKRRTRDVTPDYEVSIAATSKHQQADIYAFLSITFREKQGEGRSAAYYGVQSIWLCGYMNREEYFKKSTFMKKGQIDPSNGFKVHVDMYNLPIRELNNKPN